MNQLILITDGCSNVGIHPAAAAAQARSEGIVVNVVGVVDDGELGERGAAEVAEIARAGGGLSRIVRTDALSQTVQMMTRRTIVQTVQQTVQRELRELFGRETPIESLPPAERAQVVRLIDDATERVPLRVALLVDASASMKPKLAAVCEAVRDLTLSLKARGGPSEIAVFHYPGRDDAELDLDWTCELANAQRLFYNLNMRGTTPTGPAILRVIEHIAERVESENGRFPPWVHCRILVGRPKTNRHSRRLGQGPAPANGKSPWP